MDWGAEFFAPPVNMIPGYFHIKWKKTGTQKFPISSIPFPLIAHIWQIVILVKGLPDKMKVCIMFISPLWFLVLIKNVYIYICFH